MWARARSSTPSVLAFAAVVALSAAGCGDSVSGNGTVTTDATDATASGATTSTAKVVHRDFPQRDHIDGRIDYPDSPPFGGNHNPEWADCTGTVYDRSVPSENAVHSLEHGAVWVTYRPDLDQAGVAALRSLVEGHDYLLMSPYPGLDHAVSVQSWGFQYKTDDATDPTIRQFIAEHRQNPDTTPEYGATCTNPEFTLN